jgi:hypothetical protein
MRNPDERSAAADDMRRSFRLLAEKFHPDANKHEPNAAEFVTATPETLGDEAKGTALGGDETFHRDKFDTQGKGMPREVAAAILGVTLSVTGLLVALAMLVASPLVTRSLMPLMGIFANNEGDRNSLPVGPNDKSTLAAKLHQGPAVRSEQRLVLQQSTSYVAADSIPLGIRVDGKPDGMAVEISDLPSGTTVSPGRPLGAGVWRILATNVVNAVIHLPPGFSGPIDLAIELRRIDDTIVDRRLLHFEWPQKPTPTPESIESAGPKASVPVGAKARSQNFAEDQVAALDAIEGKGDHDPIELLIGRSEKLVSEGQVGAAPLLPPSAAEAHDARAALALGAAYAPIVLAISEARGDVHSIAIGGPRVGDVPFRSR